MTGRINIREAAIEDAPLLLDFIRGLAEYEHLEKECEATEEGLRQTLFAEKQAEALIAEYDGRPAGFALFFHNYSTFKGRRGLYIEDLFVRPESRGHGIGKALFQRLLRIAASRDCARLEWACLDWNAPAAAFYKSMGAVPLSGWTVYRLPQPRPS